MINDLKKNAFLLCCLAILLFAKFVYVPLIEWQDSTLSEVAQKEKRLVKVSQLLEDEKKLLVSLENVESQLNQFTPLFLDYSPEAEIRLSQQQRLEGLFRKHQIKPTNFGWQSSTQLDEVSLTKYRVQVRFDGLLVNVVSFLLELEASKPWYEIDNFYFSGRGITQSSLGFISGGRIVINLYVSQQGHEIDG